MPAIAKHIITLLLNPELWNDAFCSAGMWFMWYL